MSLAAFAVLLPVLAVAVWFDARNRRIPNGVTLAGLAAALTLAGVVEGSSGLLEATVGALIGAGLLLPFHLLGGLGAGDVKLMGVVGACLGPVGAFEATVFAMVAGALIALPRLFPGKGKADRRLHGPSGVLEPVEIGNTLRAARKQKLPYAGAIAAGAAVAAWRTGIVATVVGLPA